MLALERATLSRGGRPILVEVSLALRPAEVLALLGPNGAGKSTLLQALSGELRPSSGRATLDGRNLAHWSAADLARRRAVLAQQNHLTFGFGVAEVAALGRSAHAGRSTALEDAAAITHALAAVGLSTFARRDYRKLSGGEQQRVHLARALAQIWGTGAPPEPRYLLLDEPVSSLDPAYQQAVLRIARALAQRGYGVAITLHDLNLAGAVADRVALLDKGRLVADGPPADVLVPARLAAVYGVAMVALAHPETGAPVLLPAANGR